MGKRFVHEQRDFIVQVAGEHGIEVHLEMKCGGEGVASKDAALTPLSWHEELQVCTVHSGSVAVLLPLFLLWATVSVRIQPVPMHHHA